MQPSASRDLAVGLFVLAGLLAVAWMSIRVGGLTFSGGEPMRLHAAFDQVGSLKPRSPVVVAGVKVGEVSGISLGDDLRAHVIFEVDRGIGLPDDTTAAIRTAGLLGDQYVALEPGASETNFEPGDTVAFTVSALSIETLISRFATGLGGSEGEE